jgi:ribosomal protein S18 acetylase RimI-like enzyme
MSTRSPSLRRALPSDAPAVEALTAAAYGGYARLIGRLPTPMTADQVVAIRDHEVWVLADDAGGLVGILELIRQPDHLWVESVAVRPDRQGRGLGRWLLDLAEQLAADAGYAEVRLETNERFTANVAMYRARGYRETGRVPHLGTDKLQFAKTI